MSHAGPTPSPPLWQCILFAGLAGGLAWGIRGQYGHETGAMLAGLLVALTLTLLLCPQANCLAVARAVACCTVGIGIGGSMTYGQTVGLTQNATLVGNWGALRWGMLGLALKGSIWIGFGGTFLGMGLSGLRYRPREMLVIMLGLIGVSILGMWLLNEPFRPAEKVLPRIYFSADWHWEPEAQLKPRREDWGGLLFALAALILYARGVRRDSLAWRMGLWGMLGGAVGFPLGQCVQAFHAWNLDLFHDGILARIDPIINWWNFMETTFGTVMGAILGLGLWLNRHRIVLQKGEPSISGRLGREGEAPAEPLGLLDVNQLSDSAGYSLGPMSPIGIAVERLLIFVHIFLLLCAEFDLVPQLGWIYDPGLILALIPIVAISGGREWPYWLLFPITIIPIAGKTLRNLGYENHVVPMGLGWLLYVVLPIALMTAAACIFARQSYQNREALPFLRSGLLLATWLTFGLNFAFFRFPWPWTEWTYRTPNSLVFTACAVGLTVLVARSAVKTSPTSGISSHSI